MLERAVVTAATAEIGITDLPRHVQDAANHRGAKKMSLAELERAYIAEVLDYTRGKKNEAAQILGITRKTLLEKRKRYKLD